MRVLVTGGAGHIGSVIVARLAARGNEVVVYDDLYAGTPHRPGRRAAGVRQRARRRGCARRPPGRRLRSRGPHGGARQRSRSQEAGPLPQRQRRRRRGGDRGRDRRRRPPPRLQLHGGRVPFPSARPSTRTTGWRRPIRMEAEARRGAPARAGAARGLPLLQRLRRRRRRCGEDHDPHHPHPAGLARRTTARPSRVRRRLPHRTAPASATCTWPTSPTRTSPPWRRSPAPRARSTSAPAPATPSRRCSPPSVLHRAGAHARGSGRDGRRPAGPRGEEPAGGERVGWHPRRSLTDAVADAWTWMRARPGRLRGELRERRRPAGFGRSCTVAGCGASDSSVIEPSTSMSWSCARSQAWCVVHEALRAQSSGLRTHWLTDTGPSTASITCCMAAISEAGSASAKPPCAPRWDTAKTRVELLEDLGQEALGDVLGLAESGADATCPWG